MPESASATDLTDITALPAVSETLVVPVPDSLPAVLTRDHRYLVSTLANIKLSEAPDEFIQPAYKCGPASFVIIEGDAPTEAVVGTFLNEAIKPVVRPLSRKLTCELHGHMVFVTLEKPQNLCLDFKGDSLYLFHVPGGLTPPTADVIRFTPGAVHEAGVIHLKSGQTLWIEPGAIVRAQVRASCASDVHIGGGGILVGNVQKEGYDSKMVVFDRCNNVTISDITMVAPLSWMVTLGGCEDVIVRNLHQIGEVISSDGIDIVGSKNVRVEGGLLRNNDDCVAIKSFDLSETCPPMEMWGRWDQSPRNVRISGLIAANDRAGNGLEIGHELRTESVSDVVFENIDILHVHGHGAPLSVNLGDRATISDVTFRNIRIEHYYDKLVSVRIMKSRFNTDESRGHIKGVRFEDVSVVDSEYNPGYSIAIIGGWDEDHTVEGLEFHNFTSGDRTILSNGDWDLYTRFAGPIQYTSD